jgi:hypothetical protein
MNETPLALEPVVSLHFYRSGKDESVFYVTWKEGKKKNEEIPTFLGELPKKPFSNPAKYILLDYGSSDDEQNWEWAMYTKNKEAIAAKQEEISREKVTIVKITSFTLSSKNRAYGSFNNYALLIEMSTDRQQLVIHFFEDFERWASCVFTCWECGYLDELRMTP